MKQKLPAPILLLLILVPVAQAVTIDGPINWIGPAGGTVRFGSTTVTRQISVANTVYTFTNLVYGSRTETLGFDSATGQIMTIQTVQLNQIDYNVTGVQATYIRRPGYGAPSRVDGGTYTYDATTEITTVTPTGAGGVMVRWDPEQYGLFNGLLTYLRLATMIPLFIGITYAWTVYQTGEFDMRVAALIGGLVVAMVVIAAMLGNYV